MAHNSLLTTLKNLSRNQFPFINFKRLIGLKIIFCEIHIYQGLDWVFASLSLSHNSLLTLYTLHKNTCRFHDTVIVKNYLLNNFYPLIS